MATAALAEDSDDDLPPEGEEQSGGEVEASEEQARRLGWKPEDEYKGDKTKWRDWQDFLNEDLSNAPQLKATVKLLKRRLDQSDRQLKAMKSTLDEAKDYFSKAEARAYDQAVADLEEKQRAAVSVGDEDAFDAAAAKLKKLNKDVIDGKAPKAPEIDPQVQKQFRKWERDNDWYGKDEAMTAYADRVANKMGSYADNDMEPDEYLDELTERVKKEFSHKFELPRKRSAVEGVGETRSTKGQETFDNLPADAKAQFARFEKMGIPVKKTDFAKDAWDQIRKDARR